MSLLPAYYTSLRLTKSKPGKQTQAQREHEQWLRANGVHPEQLKARKPKTKKSSPLILKNVPNTVNLCDLVALGPTGLKQEEKRYTGTEIIGIAQMHKSNAVPVRGKQAAIDIAKMRRG